MSIKNNGLGGTEERVNPHKNKSKKVSEKSQRGEILGPTKSKSSSERSWDLAAIPRRELQRMGGQVIERLLLGKRLNGPVRDLKEKRYSGKR